MDDRALMQMALDALKVVNDVGVSANWHRHFDNQIKALRERLAQQEPEPVAWAKFNQGEITHSEMTDGSGCDFDLKAAGFVPLYTAPITRQENRQVAKNATTGNQEVAKSATTDNQTPECKTDPRAPHGFDRNASHSADRYVCECESWEPNNAA
jgi:hypothetical protein